MKKERFIPFIAIITKDIINKIKGLKETIEVTFWIEGEFELGEDEIIITSGTIKINGSIPLEEFFPS